MTPPALYTALLFLVLPACTADKSDGASTTDSGDHPGDADGDGYASDRDCDDGDAAVHPAAEELCNGIDDDCDDSIDEEGATGGTTWYGDNDDDGYGGILATTESCTQPAGYAASSDDCDDQDAALHPGADELCDEIDNDCDELIDEEPIDGSTYYEDADGDRYGDDTSLTMSCARVTGYSLAGGDCDDDNDEVNPDAAELCDTLDNDCDGSIDEDAVDAGSWYTDSDGDGYGEDGSETVSCEGLSEQVAAGGDCDESDGDINPGVEEPCDDVDGIDNDCNGRTDPSCASNEGYTRYQSGEGRDPDDRDCDQWWYTTWTPRADMCSECIWAMDVEFTLDTSLSYDGGGCEIEDLGDYVTAFSFDDDLYGYGYGFLWYYGSYSYDWYPVFSADWDPYTYYLTFTYGYYETTYGRGYYTNYWSGYATVNPY